MCTCLDNGTRNSLPNRVQQSNCTTKIMYVTSCCNHGSNQMKFCTMHVSALRKCRFKWALSTPTSYYVPTTSRNSITTLSTLSSHTTYVWPTDTKLTTWGRCTTQRENSNIYMCMPNHRGFRLRRTLHVVFANKTIDRGLCGRAFWSNPHTANRISPLLTHVENHEPHGSMRKKVFLSSDLLAHVNPCTAWHHGNPNSNHQKATRTGYLTLLSHTCEHNSNTCSQA